jgi:hypothetical protein
LGSIKRASAVITVNASAGAALPFRARRAVRILLRDVHLLAGQLLVGQMKPVIGRAKRQENGRGEVQVKHRQYDVIDHSRGR